MTAPQKSRLDTDWRSKLHEIIFEADTPAGKAFVILILCIIASVIVVRLDSLAVIRQAHAPVLRAAEWIFTLVMIMGYGIIAVPTSIVTVEM